ncbi:MAG TPA: oxygenase MpaB family protein [Dermatophilaceae bacterium]|nr:oxygenase MpaB family protein [Dermatophilaceae bacterium]
MSVSLPRPPIPAPPGYGWARDALRRRIATAVRDRVAGKDRQQAEDRIWRSPGQRWFGPVDPIWRLHADTSMFVGGIRALLLQSLHPLAMAGVAGHSGFKGDPWGRLQRTSTFLATTTYGTAADAERLLGRIRRVHETVSGTAPDGRAYAASDPHLLAWVHVAEADSFLSTHQVFGATPLTPDEADTYVAQLGTVAARLGVVDPPRTVAELEGALTAYRPELSLTEAAIEARDFLLWEPPLPLAARGPYAVLAGGAVATLQPWARDLLGLPSVPPVDSVARAAARAATATMRWAMTHPSETASVG